MSGRWRGGGSRVLILALLMLAFVLVAVGTGSRGNPNPRPVASVGAAGVPEVVLEQNPLLQFVATGRINGERVELLVDTGSADVALPYAVAQRLGLRLTAGGISKTGNGNVQSWRAWLDEVEVGGLRVRNVRATVLPNMAGEQGLLGMSYLNHLEVRVAAGELRLRLPGAAAVAGCVAAASD